MNREEIGKIGHKNYRAEALAQLQVTIRKRIVKLFVRRGIVDKADGKAMRSCEHDGGSRSTPGRASKLVPK